MCYKHKKYVHAYNNMNYIFISNNRNTTFKTMY